MRNSILLLTFATFAIILSGACNQEGADTQVGIDHDKGIIDPVAEEADLIVELSGDTLMMVSEPTAATVAPVKTEGNIKAPVTVKKEAKVEVAEEKLKDEPVIAKAELPVTIAPQSYTIKGSGNNIKVSGTSTLHDWTMATGTLTGNAQLQLDKSGQIVSIDALTFNLPVNTLKSKDEKLDKNAHEALDAEKYKTITFKFTRSTLTTQGNNKYIIKAVGSLTISGVTNEVHLDAVCVVNSNNSMAITGTKSFNMSEYKIKPPQFMLGTMKTGDKVTIDYNLLLAP